MASGDATSRFPIPGLSSESAGAQTKDELSTGVLMPMVYQDLRCLARAVLHGESAGQTLEPTALVHEVFLRLHHQEKWRSAQHFFATAATTMRRVLIDKARLKGRKLYRGDLQCEAQVLFPQSLSDQAARELIDLDDALEALQKIDPMAAQVAELRVFAGVTLAEVAEMLSISPSQAFREWSFARAWIKSQFSLIENLRE